MIKNLKSENEYLQRQIETLRRITARETAGPTTPKSLATFQRPLSQPPPRFEEATAKKGDESQYSPLQRKTRQSSQKRGRLLIEDETEDFRIIKFDLAQS